MYKYMYLGLNFTCILHIYAVCTYFVHVLLLKIDINFDFASAFYAEHLLPP